MQLVFAFAVTLSKPSRPYWVVSGLQYYTALNISTATQSVWLHVSPGQEQQTTRCSHTATAKTHRGRDLPPADRGNG